jgi:hypothetical protein
VLVERTRYVGRYQVICAVDFPAGRNFASEKMRGLPKASLIADGFEILLTAGHTDKESLNELKSISDFILKYIDPTKEIRWVLGLHQRQREQVFNIMPHLKHYPAKFIRTDVHLSVPNVDLNAHQCDINFIRGHVGTQVKVSGNVNLELIKALTDQVGRFDVNFSQAKDITRSALKEHTGQRKIGKVSEPANIDEKMIGEQPS